MPQIRPSRSSTLAAACLLAACSSPTVPEAGVEILPAALTFSRTPQGAVEVSYTVVNAGRESVLLTDRCGDRLSPAVEQQQGVGWALHAGGHCQTFLPMSDVPLAPGARRDEVVIVSAAPAGRYRLVLGTGQGPVASVSFTVR